jgi:hypothetical protein
MSINVNTKTKNKSNWVRNSNWKFMNLGKVGTTFNTSIHRTLKTWIQKTHTHTHFKAWQCQKRVICLGNLIIIPNLQLS